MTDLSTATIFITGATSGFGAAAARRFAGDGARLVLLGRRADRLEALKSELKVPVHVLALDIRDREAVTEAFATLPKDFAQIDVLLNNAGLAVGLEMAPKTDLDDWDAMVDTNIKGLMYCTRSALPGMVERKRGHIINMGSVAGTYPYPGGNVYGGTKAFVEQFSLNLRAELLGSKVRVTNIKPGMCETEFSVVRFRGDASKADNVYAGMKPLSADDIAECIHWVAALPAHMNINELEIMPVDQAFSPFAVHREGK
ncbi:SDR family NAD(P)-dependent oxidoreductase [Telmatospirillum siberiense]|uniref:NAD(P)-dependent oxidoreductase n=1 Tax=Telmatospirillum siberiense TaxID=382514 RepID=A0A2N3PYY3_9PROT|nr:SDR family NAD(P)-dependent oxidoreductase [Telmatospirillum siberiense]PKU25617.1 NAD(P)-dependent oxidoreductase [Telmatospirillum siberiense]